ncbi:MAG: helix-turn-helix domain-containing protein [Acidilobaceae archaeon]
MLLFLALAAIISGSLTIDIYPDGSLIATYELSLSQQPARVSLRTLPGASHVFTYSGDIPVPFQYNSSTGLLEFPVTSQRATARLYHGGLTEKKGAIWRLALPPQDFAASLLLPRGALVVSVEPKDFEALAAEGRVLLKFPAGKEIRIEYVLPPPSPSPQPSPPSSPLVPSPTPLPLLPALGLLGIFLVLLAVGGYLFYRRRAVGVDASGALPEELDSRDRSILQRLERGELTAQDLMRETGIPKTPLYRRLEKLERMGLVEKSLRGGITFYKLRQQQRSQ